MKKESKWTHFWDMHSGGDQKLKWSHIFIEAPQKEAEIIFQNRFGRNPNRVTCTCCGTDYSIEENISLQMMSGYIRGCDYADGKYIERKNKDGFSVFVPFKKFLKEKAIGKGNNIMTGRKKVLIIWKNGIKPSERKGELKEEGFVWRE